MVDAAGKLVGIVSEGDFIRRSEIGTQRKRGRWLKFLLGAGLTATDYVHEHGGKVSEVMTTDPITVAEDATLEQIVTSMETNGVKRLPVMRGDKLVGIVSRANLLQAVASLAREIPDPTADDDHIRSRIIAAIEKRLEPVRAKCHRARRHRPSQRRDHRRKFAAGGDGGCGECRGRQEGSRPFVLDRHHVGNVSGIARRRRDGEGRLGAAPALPARGASYLRALSVNARMMSSRAMIPASRCSASSTGTLFIRWSTISCRTRVSFVAGST